MLLTSRAMLAAVSIALSAPFAMAQSLGDLDRLTTATWHLAVSPSDDLDAFGSQARDHYPRATVTDQTAQTLTGWEDVATHWRVELLQFSVQDSIDCLGITVGGLVRLRGVADHAIPDALAPFRTGGLIAAPRDDAVTYRMCTGIVHPPGDFADYDIWARWLGEVEITFAASGLVITHASASGWDGYVAGHLERDQIACDQPTCIAFAAPYAVALRDLGTAQTAITIGAFARAH